MPNMSDILFPFWNKRRDDKKIIIFADGLGTREDIYLFNDLNPKPVP